MTAVTADEAAIGAIPWGSCPSAQAAETGRGGNDLPCCVHVSHDGQDSAGYHVSLFCCWCGTAVPAAVAGLPPRTPSSRRHGPIAGGCRPARRGDVSLSRR